MKLDYSILILFFLSFNVYGCKNDSKNKKYRIEYYDSGNIKSRGWYLHDTIPVDSIIYFFENGNVSSIERRNNIGALNGGISFYYENGSLYQLINYVDNNIQGFSYEFYPDGGLKNKIYHFNNEQIGDSYWFYDNGFTRKYSFFDFKGRNRNLITYDSLGNILEDSRPSIFVDSVITYSDSLDSRNFNTYDIRLAISNPPKCITLVKIDYIIKQSQLLHSDSVTNKQFYFQKKMYSDSITGIKLFGVQYDSIKNTYFYHTANLVIEN